MAAKIGPTCAGPPSPELYVICEGTLAEILDGNVACYPYDPFAT